MQFELLRGLHRSGGRTYQKGDIIEAGYDMVAVAGGQKFRRLHEEEQVRRKSKPRAVRQVEEEDEEEPLGQDVSDDFKNEKDLLVFKDGKKYWITTADVPGEPLNDDPLTSKKAVNEFIDDHEG